MMAGDDIKAVVRMTPKRMDNPISPRPAAEPTHDA